MRCGKAVRVFLCPNKPGASFNVHDSRGAKGARMADGRAQGEGGRRNYTCARTTQPPEPRARAGVRPGWAAAWMPSRMDAVQPRRVALPEGKAPQGIRARMARLYAIAFAPLYAVGNTSGKPHASV